MSGWDAHLQSMVGSTNGLGAILTREKGEVCTQSAGVQATANDATEAASLLVDSGKPPTFFDAKHTIIGKKEGATPDLAPVFTLLKKPAAQSGVGAIAVREFVVVTFTKTLTLVLKVGSTDNQVDAAERVEKVRDYLLGYGM